MTLSTRPTRSRRNLGGMTLIELTVVILVLLSLVMILFLGAQAWKRGTDRASCLMQIRQVQVAVRSYSNLNEFRMGDDVSPVDLKAVLVGNSDWVQQSPVCPGGGTYSYGGNIIPPLGRLYMDCSLAASDDHEPEDFAGW